MPSKRMKIDAVSDHLASMGFQLHAVRRLGQLTHLYVPDRNRAAHFKNFQNASVQMDRLRAELRRVFRKGRAGREGRGGGHVAPRTLRTVFRRAGEPLGDFLRREEAGVRQHAALRGPQPIRAPPVLDCITDVFQVDAFVPRLHFAGYSPALDAYVTVMDYAPGATPSARTSAIGIAAAERALFTLWVRGVALPGLLRSGVRVAASSSSSSQASVVDFTAARAPLKTLRAVQSSRNPLFPELWDPPRWLAGLVRGATGIEAARQATWLWSPACVAAATGTAGTAAVAAGTAANNSGPSSYP